MTVSVIAFVNTEDNAVPAGGRRNRPVPKRRLRASRSSGRPPRGLLRWIKDRIDRRLCWGFALVGSSLAKTTYWLSREGIIGRHTTLRLLRQATALHVRSIRCLRKGSW
ncbi:hypothetical protein [Brucella anthropi]|uniref:hypothetical protein n=1 Tax=Brucella anthropi TaxID=529 RepID=UPI00384DDB42